MNYPASSSVICNLGFYVEGILYNFEYSYQSKNPTEHCKTIIINEV